MYTLYRWLKAWGADLASEKKQRDLMKTQLADIHVHAEAVPFSFQLKRGAYELRPAPLAFVESLKHVVFYLLEENDRYATVTMPFKHSCTCTCTVILFLFQRQKKLIWHNGSIPHNELWVKVGGDKGGSSFKMSLQLVNVMKPNSVKNSCVFALFEATDSPANLHIALARYKDEITDLQTSTWK